MPVLAPVVPEQLPSKKRNALAAGLDSRPNKSVKRRASKACQCCRARKVRCNVVEHGSPCTNCRLDEVDCIVSESKRKRKSISKGDNDGIDEVVSQDLTRKLSNAETNPSCEGRGWPVSPTDQSSNNKYEHIPHTLYRSHGSRPPHIENMPCPGLTNDFHSNLNSFHEGAGWHETGGISALESPAATISLPYFIKPLPARISPEDAAFLQKKDALSLPNEVLRNELLRSYIEFIDPCMPVIELNEVLTIIEQGDGSLGRISLLLFQAMMFAGCSSVDMIHLRNAGYTTRKEARKSFYLKARLLYDFDYDTDRISMLQALLLLTYWYERPDDQKDTWHWCGVAISVAHTIGLHRDPAKLSLDPHKRKLWKRIWWACYTRDVIVSLGMRRPTRIKTGEYNVPMLEIDDFDLNPWPQHSACVPQSCRIARSSEMKRSVALMHIANVKLSICISHIMRAQYSVEDNLEEDGNGRAADTLVPKRLDADSAELKECHEELVEWLANLPEQARMPELESLDGITRGDAPVILGRAFLHMLYYTAMSALHRPQAVVDMAATSATDPRKLSKDCMRLSASKTTSIVRQLLELDMARFLPTSGVTVVLPAIINHLMDMKATDRQTRRTGLQGFCYCIQVLSRLRDCYAAADYTFALVEAAVRRADIEITNWSDEADQQKSSGKANSVEDLVDAGLRQNLVVPIMPSQAATPPPDLYNGNNTTGNQFSSSGNTAAMQDMSDDSVAKRLEIFLATTPPASSNEDQMSQNDVSHTYLPTMGPSLLRDLERDFESLINVENMAETFTFGDGGLANMQGESSGFFLDMDILGTGASGGMADVQKDLEDAAPVNNELVNMVTDEGTVIE